MPLASFALSDAGGPSLCSDIAARGVANTPKKRKSKGQSASASRRLPLGAPAKTSTASRAPGKSAKKGVKSAKKW
jgi:hypothetical protein